MRTHLNGRGALVAAALMVSLLAGCHRSQGYYGQPPIIVHHYGGYGGGYGGQPVIHVHHYGSSYGGAPVVIHHYHR